MRPETRFAIRDRVRRTIVVGLGIVLMSGMGPAVADDDPPPDAGNQGEGTKCDNELGAHQPFYPGQSASQTYDQTFTRLGNQRLPDLGRAEGDTAWIPQGLAYWEDWNGEGNDLLLVTAYRKGHNTRIHGLDAETGEPVGTVETKESHAGGIAVIGDYAYSSAEGSESVHHYYLPALRNALEEYDPDEKPPFVEQRGKPTTVEQGVAFLGTDGETLYAGRYENKNNLFKSVMEAYTPDRQGQLSRDDDFSYMVPLRTQGMTVAGDDFLFSVSPTPETETPGRRSYIYRVSSSDMAENDTIPQLPPYEFKKATECFRAPSMSEGVVTHGDKTYLSFESGAAPYAFDPDNTPENPIRFIHAGELAGDDDDDDDDGPEQGTSTTTYTGPTDADYHDSFTASARLTDGSGPVSGANLRFSLGKGGGTQECGGTTNSSGVAECELTPTQAPATTSLTVRFGGSAALKPSSDTSRFTITRQETALTYGGPKKVANGTPVKLSGTLTEESADGRPVAGRSVTLALGRGDDRQDCTGTTDAEGNADCTIESLDQPLNDDATVPVTVDFDGDTYYEPSQKRATVLLEYYTGRSYGITADVNLLGLGPDVDPTPDTGQVRTAHASRNDPGCSVGIDTLLLRTGSLCPKVVTSLAPGTSRATSAVQDATIGLPGLPLIEVEAATARSTSTCSAGGSARGTTELRLRVGGETVELTGEPNADVNLPGAARLVINEQRPVPGAEHGMTVNAAHLVAANGAVDLVIGSATSGVHNCAS